MEWKTRHVVDSLLWSQHIKGEKKKRKKKHPFPDGCFKVNIIIIKLHMIMASACNNGWATYGKFKNFSHKVNLEFIVNILRTLRVGGTE